MEAQAILAALGRHYDAAFTGVELHRAAGWGNATYTVSGAEHTWFLKTIHLPPTEMQTARASMDMQVYLLKQGFPVIPIVYTRDGAPFASVAERDGEYLFVLSEFIKGGGADKYEHLEKAGELVGRLHRLMRDYPGELPARDKPYFIDRYVGIMRAAGYAKWTEFQALGDELWERVEALPRGYCHCDMYDGNVHTTESGEMYIVDFDTSCMAFPGYDVILFCNRTHYFEYDAKGWRRTKARLKRFLPGYLRYSSLSERELAAFPAMLGIYHFQLPPAGLERNGCDAGTLEFFDKQYDWLLKWREQCAGMGIW